MLRKRAVWINSAPLQRPLVHKSELTTYSIVRYPSSALCSRARGLVNEEKMKPPTANGNHPAFTVSRLSHRVPSSRAGARARNRSGSRAKQNRFARERAKQDRLEHKDILHLFLADLIGATPTHCHNAHLAFQKTRKIGSCRKKSSNLSGQTPTNLFTTTNVNCLAQGIVAVLLPYVPKCTAHTV